MYMKKIFGFFLLISIIGVSCKPKETPIEIIPDIQKNHLQRNHLFGDVKEITTEKYIMVNNSDSIAEEKHLSTTIQKYSTDGLLTAVITLNQDKDTLFMEKIFYSKDAKVVSSQKTDQANKVIAETTYQYDRNGFKTEEKYIENDQVYMTILYKNDDKGNAIEMTQKRDSITLTNKLRYDSNGLISQIEQYDPFGKLFKYITYEYDNYGDEVNRRVFNQNNKQIEFTYTVYNQKGHLQKILYEDLIHGIKTLTEYSGHDSKGNWTIGTYKKQNQIIYKQKRTILYY